MQKSYVAGRKVPIHGHNIYEFVYYLKASGASQYNKKKNFLISNNFSYYDNLQLSDFNHFSFTNNSYILIPPHILHREQHNEEAQVIIVGFSLDEMDMIEDAKLHKDVGDTIKHYALKVVEEYKKRECDFKLKINCILTEMLIEIKRRSDIPHSVKSLVTESISYIDEYYMEPINIQDLAEGIGYHPDYYSSLFKQQTGLSPKQYIIQKRIQTAKELLVNTNMSIAQISEACGFQFSSQFTRLFEKYEHITPKKFRNDDHE